MEALKLKIPTPMPLINIEKYIKETLWSRAEETRHAVACALLEHLLT